MPEIGVLAHAVAVAADEPHGTFHDARLSNIRIERAAGTRTCGVELSVGDPDSPDRVLRDRRRAGELVLMGLRVWNLPDVTDGSNDRLWLTADGVLEQCPVLVDRALIDTARGAKIAWFLFAADRNAFAYLAADAAHFAWS